MKLNTIDIKKISKYKPEFLRLYNIDSLTEEQENFLSAGLNRIVRKISLNTKDKELQKAIIKQFPNVHYHSDELIIAERNSLSVEIDITTKCNLACNNCSRFSQFKSSWVDMTLSDIKHFIKENKHYGKKLTVNILGGEPTIHPNIDEIIIMLYDVFHIVLTTNGIIPYTPPVDITVENSAKEKGEMPLFSTTMLAPIDDDEYKYDDYSVGCYQAEICGAGYTKDGYYPCSIASAIDRMTRSKGGPREGKVGIGKSSIAEAYRHKQDIFNELCRYCGTYKMRNYIHFDIKYALTDKQEFSNSWKFMEDRK